MFVKNYKIADHIITISTKHKFFHYEAKDYVFDGVPDFLLEITDEDVAFERECEMNSEENLNSPDSYLEYIAVLRKIMDKIMPEGYFLMHGSCVAVDGQGYLFTAKSGTGKSTHTALWQKLFKDRAVMVNGDKPIIKVDNGVAYLYGTPWAGKERMNKNMKVPLKAIIQLTRDTFNHIEPMQFSDIFPILYVQLHKTNNPQNVVSAMAFLDSLSKATKFYKIGCNMDIEAAKVAYKGMNEKLLFEDVLAFDGVLVYKAVGISMYPLIIQNHDLLTIEQYKDKPKKYDVILYKRDNGTYVMHRILEVRENDYVLCGDNQYRKEYGVLDRHILGVLTSIDKGNGKIIKMDDENYLKYVHKICDHFYRRAFKLWFKYLKYRIKRKLGKDKTK